MALSRGQGRRYKVAAATSNARTARTRSTLPGFRGVQDTSPCPECGATNILRTRRPAARERCGKRRTLAGPGITAAAAASMTLAVAMAAAAVAFPHPTQPLERRIAAQGPLLTNADANTGATVSLPLVQVDGAYFCFINVGTPVQQLAVLVSAIVHIRATSRTACVTPVPRCSRMATRYVSTKGASAATTSMHTLMTVFSNETAKLIALCPDCPQTRKAAPPHNIDAGRHVLGRFLAAWDSCYCTPVSSAASRIQRCCFQQLRQHERDPAATSKSLCRCSPVPSTASWRTFV